MSADSEPKFFFIDTSLPVPSQAQALQEAFEKGVREQQQEQSKLRRSSYLNRKLSTLLGDYQAALRTAALGFYDQSIKSPAQWRNNRNGFITDSKLSFAVNKEGIVDLKEYQASFGFAGEKPCPISQQIHIPHAKCIDPALKISFKGNIFDPKVLKIRFCLDSCWYPRFEIIPNNKGFLSEFTSELTSAISIKENEPGIYGGYQFTLPDKNDYSRIGLAGDSGYTFMNKKIEFAFKDGYYDLVRGGFSRWSSKEGLFECEPERLIEVIRETLSILPAQRL